MDTLIFRSKISCETRKYSGRMVGGMFAADDGKVFEVDGPRVSLAGTRRDVTTGIIADEPHWFSVPNHVGELT